MAINTSKFDQSTTSVKPWWKQRWPWFLISGPAIAAIGCGVTIWLAYSGADQQIKEGVVKQGLKVISVPADAKSLNQDKGGK